MKGIKIFLLIIAPAVLKQYAAELCTFCVTHYCISVDTSISLNYIFQHHIKMNARITALPR